MQGVVIQGPTNYYKEVLKSYKNVPNVVWSTWDDEPSENIEYISKYIPVVLNQKPLFPGYLNINMQTVSTMGGVNYLKEKGINEILKVRGDIIITNITKFLSILKGKDMAFLAIAKENVRNDCNYELIYKHYSHDYPVDLVVYGSTSNIENSFGFFVDRFQCVSLSAIRNEGINYIMFNKFKNVLNILPNENIPPEALILCNFLMGNDLEYKTTYNHLINNGVYFYLNDCIDNQIELNWLKHNNDLVKMHNDQINYEF